MRHKDVIFLVTKTTSYDELANPIVSVTERMVYANEMSVSMNEFYTAGNSGIHPEKQFEIHTLEYGGESTIKHNDKTYKVIRTAQLGDNLRIICEGVVGYG